LVNSTPSDWRYRCRTARDISERFDAAPGKAISQSLGRLISPSAKLLAAVIETLEKFYGQARYLANRDVHIWSQAQASGNLDVRKLIEILKEVLNK
jgi:hypothetical protein